MHNLISRSLRFSPDAPAGGGTAVASPPAGGDSIAGVPVDKSMQPPKPAAMNLDSEVQHGGKTYKLSDLIGAQERATKAESSKAEMETAIKSLYGTGPQIETPEEFEEAAKHLRYAMKVGGRSDSDIETEIKKLRVNAGMDTADDPTDEDKIASHPAVTQNQKLAESILRRHADTIINAATTSTAELKKLVDFTVKTNGAEDGAAIAKQIQESLRRELAPLIKERMTRAGGTLDDIGWIDEEMPKAAAKVIERYKPFIRMIEQVGKGESGPDFLAGQPEKPVERPSVIAGPRHVVEKNLEDWVTDRVLRYTQQTLTGTPG